MVVCDVVDSEAIDSCDITPLSPASAASVVTSTPSSCTNMTSVDTGSSHQVEALVFSDDDDVTSCSPKQLSPVDASYCGTMKSDDSGIVMGE